MSFGGMTWKWIKLSKKIACRPERLWWDHCGNSSQ